MIQVVSCEPGPTVALTICGSCVSATFLPRRRRRSQSIHHHECQGLEMVAMSDCQTSITGLNPSGVSICDGFIEVNQLSADLSASMTAFTSLSGIDG